MKRLIILTLVLAPLFTLAQGKGSKKIVNKDSIGYNEEYYVMKKNPTVKHGEYYKQTKTNGIAFEKGFYKNGQRDGKWTIKLQGESQVVSKGSYSNGKKVGQWVYGYFEKVDQIYDHTTNKVIQSKRGTAELDYIGGMTLIHTSIQDSLVYSESAKKRGIRGKVIVTFNVNTKGEIYHVVLKKGVHTLLDTEAMNVIRTIPSAWILPLKNGEATNGSFEWVINFGSK